MKYKRFQRMKWTVQAKGWCLLCPVWLAEIDSPAIVPIPRKRWLGWWLELMYLWQQAANSVACLADPAAEVGFWFHHVEYVPPFQIEF